MAYSLGLTLYNLRPRREGTSGPERPPRPSGRLVCLITPHSDAARSVSELARRLTREDGITVVLTCPAAPSVHPDVIVQPPPPDTPPDVRAYLDHWRPDLLIFTDGELRPALLYEAQQRKLSVIMVDGEAPYILRDRDGWYPGLMRTSLSGFSHIYGINDTAARAFRKAGAPVVSVCRRMDEQSATLPHMEAERAALARQLGTRPVWLAAAIPPAEEGHVIAAHRAALRHSHRLLLIIVPQDAAHAADLSARFEAEGWAVANRSLDEEPAADTEVFLVDDAEYGLWYRLAPVTFLGGSLSGEGALRNPLEPASHGSAILCGPRAGAYAATFGRLGSAQAVRTVGSADDLADALAETLAPDRAARHAHAAWGVISEGAEATETILAAVRSLMDTAL